MKKRMIILAILILGRVALQAQDQRRVIFAPKETDSLARRIVKIQMRTDAMLDFFERTVRYDYHHSRSAWLKEFDTFAGNPLKFDGASAIVERRVSVPSFLENLSIYRFVNAVYEHPKIYSVAISRTGSVYPLVGFGRDTFEEFIETEFRTVANETQALAIVELYFATVGYTNETFSIVDSSNIRQYKSYSDAIQPLQVHKQAGNFIISLFTIFLSDEIQSGSWISQYSFIIGENGSVRHERINIR